MIYRGMRSIKIRGFIQEYGKLVGCEFSICEDCKGTGLKNFIKLQDGGYNWSGDYCSECDGTGYINWIDNDMFSVCKCCEGIGCSKCKGKGILDWVDKMVGDKDDRYLSR